MPPSFPWLRKRVPDGKHQKWPLSETPAVVLEAMGMGAAATKYNVFASLSNMPILYMTKVDGWAHAHYGPSGMLYIEALSGVVGFVVFMGILKASQKRAPATV